jgi:hypothetical protein
MKIQKLKNQIQIRSSIMGIIYYMVAFGVVALGIGIYACIGIYKFKRPKKA